MDPNEWYYVEGAGLTIWRHAFLRGVCIRLLQYIYLLLALM